MRMESKVKEIGSYPFGNATLNVDVTDNKWGWQNLEPQNWSPAKLHALKWH